MEIKELTKEEIKKAQILWEKYHDCCNSIQCEECPYYKPTIPCEVLFVIQNIGELEE